MLQPTGQGEEMAIAKANVNVNIIIQAGVNIIGSKNVVVFNGKRDVSRDVSKDDTKADAPSAERKRRAESVSCHCGYGRSSKRILTLNERSL